MVCFVLFLTCNCLKYSGKKNTPFPFFSLYKISKGFFCQKRLGYGFTLEGLLTRAEISIVMTRFSSLQVMINGDFIWLLQNFERLTVVHNKDCCLSRTKLSHILFN